MQYGYARISVFFRWMGFRWMLQRRSFWDGNNYNKNTPYLSKRVSTKSLYILNKYTDIYIYIDRYVKPYNHIIRSDNAQTVETRGSIFFAKLLSRHACEKATDEWLALCSHSVDGWQKDILLDLLQHFLLHDLAENVRKCEMPQDMLAYKMYFDVFWIYEMSFPSCWLQESRECNRIKCHIQTPSFGPLVWRSILVVVWQGPIFAQTFHAPLFFCETPGTFGYM